MTASPTPAAQPRVLFAVSADLPAGVAPAPGPRKDYAAIATELDATLLDRTEVARFPLTRLIARVLGVPVAQACLAFWRRRQFDAILTDGEHIGIPLALLLKLFRSRVAHVTIGHRISAPKKVAFWRTLKVWQNTHKVLLHATLQQRIAVEQLGVPEDHLELVPYQVDTDFWDPAKAAGVAEERMICSAGLELRDYPTLFAAVRVLDVDVVVAAASNWSKRRNTALDVERPENVSVTSLDYFGLRELYARAAVVVVPVQETDFQAGVTTILEAMAMGKPVIVTHTAGQTDVVEDRRATTRSAPPRFRPTSLLRRVAAEAGIEIEPNGFYVPPANPEALRKAIKFLMDHPEERARLGAAGRRAMTEVMRVDQFAERVARIVRDTAQERRPRTAANQPAATPAPIASAA
jgi:glycosyltransferase involved in cell wall biosynthesis